MSFDNFKPGLKCPKCGAPLNATMKQLASGPVLCRCGAKITTEGAAKPVEAMRGLEKALKGLGAKRVR